MIKRPTGWADYSHVIEADGAGAGAREVYERLVAARLRRLHAGGASKEELLAARDDSPAHEAAWAIGAEGERSVGKVLDEWARVCGFAVLHDLTCAGRRANLDHVIVGPCGVAVIDTKAWSGAVRVTPTAVRVGSWSKRRELAGVAAQVRSIRELLRAHGVEAPVHGFLCLANRNPGVPAHEVVAVGAMAVGTPEAVAGAVAQGDRCSRSQVDAAVAVLTEHFTVRGHTPARNLLVGPSRVPTTPLPGPKRPSRSPGRRAQRRVVARRPLLVRVLARAAPLVVGLAILAGALGNEQRPSDALLSSADVDRMLPVLRSRAAHVAGGAVRGPARTTTPDEIRLRFRRGGCRVVMTLDRRTAVTARDAGVVAGPGCSQR